MTSKRKILQTTLTIEKVVDGNIELEEKTYVVPRVSAGAVRELKELEADGSIYMNTPEDLDRLIAYICGTLFRNQFTVDEFYEGVDAIELDEKIFVIMMQVRGMSEKEAKKQYEEIGKQAEKERGSTEEEEKN